MLELPSWAAGLSLGGKVHSGPVYFEGPAVAELPPPTETLTTVSDDAADVVVEGPGADIGRALDSYLGAAPSLPNTKRSSRAPSRCFSPTSTSTPRR